MMICLLTISPSRTVRAIMTRSAASAAPLLAITLLMSLVGRPAVSSAQQADSPTDDPVAEAGADADVAEEGPAGDEALPDDQADGADEDELDEDAETEEEEEDEQQYIELPVDESKKNDRFKVAQILRGGQTSEEEQQIVRDYYLNYRFPEWTLKKSRSQLPRLRQNLRNDLRTAETGPAHDYLNALALDFMTKMAAAERVHPAARVNAMLMVGELNQVEANSPGDLPTPLPEALPALMQSLDAPDLPDSVRAAALVGLQYHVRFGQLADADRDAIVQRMGALASTTEPPAGRSAQGHAWMRTKAAEILGDLRAPGDQGVVARALADMVANSDNPMLLRCTAAQALARLDYAGQSGVDAGAIADALAGLAADAIREATTRYQEDPERFVRRYLKYRLLCAQLGLVGNPEDSGMQGIASAATGPAREAVGRYADALTQASELFDDRRMEDGTLIERLQQVLQQLTPEQPQG